MPILRWWSVNRTGVRVRLLSGSHLRRCLVRNQRAPPPYVGARHPIFHLLSSLALPSISVGAGGAAAAKGMGQLLRAGIQVSLVLGFATCGAASPRMEQIITDPAAFVSAIAAVRAEAHATDKFAEPAPFPLEGKTFRLTIPAIEGGEGRGTVFYDYEDGALIIDASPRNVWPTLAGPS